MLSTSLKAPEFLNRLKRPCRPGQRAESGSGGPGGGMKDPAEWPLSSPVPNLPSNYTQAVGCFVHPGEQAHAAISERIRPIFKRQQASTVSCELGPSVHFKGLGSTMGLTVECSQSGELSCSHAQSILLSLNLSQFCVLSVYIVPLFYINFL